MPYNLAIVCGIGMLARAVSLRIRVCYRNIQACLKAAGASTYGIIKTVTYVTDLDAYSKYADMRARYLGPELPTSTTVKVDRLAGPDFLVEMEAVATVN